MLNRCDAEGKNHCDTVQIVGSFKIQIRNLSSLIVVFVCVMLFFFCRERKTTTETDLFCGFSDTGDIFQLCSEISVGFIREEKLNGFVFVCFCYHFMVHCRHYHRSIWLMLFSQYIE